MFKKVVAARREFKEDVICKELGNTKVILQKINRELELEYFLTLLRSQKNVVKHTGSFSEEIMKKLLDPKLAVKCHPDLEKYLSLDQGP